MISGMRRGEDEELAAVAEWRMFRNLISQDKGHKRRRVKMVIDCKKPCKKKRSTMLTVEQMVDIALGTPEIGAVNFNVLHALIHVIIQQLNIQKCLVEFKGYDSERMEGIILSAKPGPILKLSEYMIDVNDNRPCPPKDKPSRQSKEDECKEEGKEGPSPKKPPCECAGKKKKPADDEKEKVDKAKEESDAEDKKKVTKRELNPEECVDEPEPEPKKIREFKKPCPCKAAKDQADVCPDESLKAVPSSYYGSDSEGACQTIVRVEPVGERCDSWRSRPALAHESMVKLEEKVAMLQDAFEALEQMPTNEELKKRTQGTGCVSTPVKDLWQLYNLNKRVESCEGTIEKLASMIEDLVKETCNFREAMMVIAGAVDDMECADQTARSCCAALQGRSGSSPEGARTTPAKSETQTVTFSEKPPEVKTETEMQTQPQPQPQPSQPSQPLKPTPCPRSQIDCSKKSGLAKSLTQEAPADQTSGPSSAPASEPAPSAPAQAQAQAPEPAPEPKEPPPPTASEPPPESAAPSAKSELPSRSPETSAPAPAPAPAPLPPSADMVPYASNRPIPPSEMCGIGPEFYKMSSGEKFCVLKEYVDCLVCQVKHLAENAPGNQILSKLCALVSLQKQLDTLETEWRLLLTAFGNQGIKGLIDALLHMKANVDNLEASLTKLITEQRKSFNKLAEIEAQSDYLKNVKADIEYVSDLLAGKADAALLNRKVSHDQFDAACDDLTRGLDEALERLLQQEAMWNEAMEELQKILDSKLDKVEMMPLKEFINKKLRCLQEKLKQLAQLRKDAEAAGAKSRIIRNLNCIACDAEVVMKMDNKSGYNHPAASPNKSLKPMLTYELDQVRKAMKKGHPCRAATHPEEASPCPDVQKKLAGIPLTTREAVDSKVSKLAHFCNRYCGGSHTITTPQQRVTRIGHFLTEFGPQAMAIFHQECEEAKPQPPQETENADKPC